jgi:hypothetical protein
VKKRPICSRDRTMGMVLLCGFYNSVAPLVARGLRLENTMLRAIIKR